MYGAYEHYFRAGMYNAAHDLAVLQLAPDAVIRKDMKLLQTLFQRFTTKGVHDWNVRGKVRHSHLLIEDLTDCLSVPLDLH